MPVLPRSCLRLRPISYEAQTKEQLAEAYSLWADTYDIDSASYGYQGPSVAAAAIVKHVPDKTAAVLDVGCGSGLVGEHLEASGYTRVVGVDLSQAMLDVARDKGCYHRLELADVDALPREQFPDGTFDAAVSVGTFTPNHVGLQGLGETLRVVRPGGLLCLSLRDDFIADEANGFKTELDRLVAEGIVAVTDVTPAMPYTPAVSADITFRCWVLGVRHRLQLS